METALRDLRSAFRQLRSSPGFAAVAILTLGLGIGVATALFSVVEGTLLRPLPFPDADRVVGPVALSPDGGYGAVTYPDARDWAAQRDVFEHVAVFQPGATNLATEDAPERVITASVTDDFFEALGVRPARGRDFTAVEHSATDPSAVILSDGLWRRRFGADPAVVGSTIRVNGGPRTVVGVLPAGAEWPLDAEMWTPALIALWDRHDLERRDNHVWSAVARLQPGVSLDTARARVAAIARRVQLEHPEAERGGGATVLTLQDWLVESGARRALLVLFGAVALVLLVACVNVAGLVLARSAARAREMAVRAALGAGRGRLVGQLLSESLLLALCAGGAGIAIAGAAIALFRRLAPAGLPRVEQAGLNPLVLVFALAVSSLTALVFGLLPALQGARAELEPSLREGGKRIGSGVRGQRLRAALVVGQVALSLVLLVGAGLMLRSFASLQRVNPGVRAERLVTMSLTVPGAAYPEGSQRARVYADLLREASDLPGVRSAAITSALPVGGGGFYLGRAFLLEGQPEPPQGAEFAAEWNVVSPGWFQTAGVPLLRGRDFTARDDSASTPVMILSESLARRMFPRGDALGKRVRSWRDENVLREVVGIVSDVRYYGLASDPEALVYVPHAQSPWGSMQLVVRHDGDAAAAVAGVRAVLKRLDPGLPIADVRTMEELVSASVAGPRTTALLLSIFAGAALLLAAVGLYGVVAYAVSLRTRELGIRMALGAAAADVRRLVLGQGAVLAGLGVAIGLAGALAASRVLQGLLYGVSATDPAVFAALSMLLAAVALGATWVPAFRASRLDPTAALREE